MARQPSLNSRRALSDLAERRLPRGGWDNIVGADAAECREHLEEARGGWPTAGARPLHHDRRATFGRSDGIGAKWVVGINPATEAQL